MLEEIASIFGRRMFWFLGRPLQISKRTNRVLHVHPQLQEIAPGTVRDEGDDQ